MRYVITASEVRHSNWPFVDQALLRILKERGAPVTGITWFAVKPGYKWERSQDFDGTITFDIEKE